MSLSFPWVGFFENARRSAIVFLCLPLWSASCVAEVSLAEALDNTNILWNANPAMSWFGQTNVSLDGVDAAQTRILPGDTNGSSRSLIGEFVGSGALSWKWRIESGQQEDHLIFIPDGGAQQGVPVISGNTVWRQASHDFTQPGNHAVEWRHVGNSSNVGGAWIDDVRFAPQVFAPVSNSPPFAVVTNHQAFLTVNVGGTPPFAYQWFNDGVAIPLATNASLTLPLLGAPPGVYAVEVSNPAGTILVGSEQSSLVSLAEALDTTNLTWRTSGDGAWFGKTGIGFLADDAARPEDLAAGLSAHLETTVHGSGSLVWRWRRDAAAGQLSVDIDGVREAVLSAADRWTVHSLNFYDLGDHDIRFTYEGNGGPSEVAIDRFAFIPATFPPYFVTSPSTRGVLLGESVTLDVEAFGNVPLHYQWSQNGAAIAEATNRSLSFPAVTLAHDGAYSVRVSNAYGALEREVIRLRVLAPVALGEAVDAPQFSWTSGPSNWVGHPELGMDGDDAALGRHTSSHGTWIETILMGPGRLTWNSKASGLAFPPLGFQLLVNGQPVNNQAVTNLSAADPWKPGAFALNRGSNTVRWLANNDLGMPTYLPVQLDRVAFTPGPVAPRILRHPVSQTVMAGDSAEFFVEVAASDPEFSWFLSGGGVIPGATNAMLTIPQARISDAGTYFVVVTNSAGTAVSYPISLEVRALTSLGEALDNADLSWTAGGAASWQGITRAGAVNTDAAELDALALNLWESAWLQTVLPGPGKLRWRWKRENAPPGRIIFATNGVIASVLAETFAWQTGSQLLLGAGPHQVRWTFERDRHASGSNRNALIDDVSFEPYVNAFDLLLNAGRGPRRFRISVPRRSRAVLESTTSLRAPHWTVMQTNVDPSMRLEFSLTNMSEPQRFFRVVPKD